MKHLISIITIAIIVSLSFASCSYNDINHCAEEDSNIVFSLSLPVGEQPYTRAILVEKDLRNYTVKWNLGDVFTLFFDYNNHIYISEGKIISMDESGTTAQISAQLPEGVNQVGSYRVYGISEKGGRIINNQPQVYVSLYSATKKQFKVPVWFSAEVNSRWPEIIQCSHLGTYEILHFKNKTSNNITVTYNGFKSENPWYYEYGVYYPLEDKLLAGIEYVPSSELYNNHPTSKIAADKTDTFVSWYIPTGEKMNVAFLELSINDQMVTSINSKSSDIEIEKGKAYHLYATWDGEKLTQGLDAFTDELRLSVSDLIMAPDSYVFVDILSGNGSYSVTSEDPTIVDAYIKNDKVNINSAYPGETSINVTDLFTYETRTIKVNVVPFGDNLYERIMQDMIRVEPGTFIMGDPNSQDEYSSPAHQVTLTKPFYIGKFEVTNKLYREVMYDEKSEDSTSTNYAVGSIMWYMVRDFLSELNKKTNKNFRLPTNAEWEFAARGGIYSKGYIYPGSNEWAEVSNLEYNEWWENPVGTKRPNELGIYDMSGGMIEWVEDNYYEYTSEPETDPRHYDPYASTHITRWTGSNLYEYIWNWYPYPGPASCRSDFGFRIVLPVDENY